MLTRIRICLVALEAAAIPLTAAPAAGAGRGDHAGVVATLGLR